MKVVAITPMLRNLKLLLVELTISYENHQITLQHHILSRTERIIV